MEGRASNWRQVLLDFESRLPSADYVAIDTELTGVDLEARQKTTGGGSTHLYVYIGCMPYISYNIIIE